MKQVQKVWAELSAKAQEAETPQEVELSEEQKVELGAIDDLRNDYKSIAAKAVPIKNVIMGAANDLEKVSNDLSKVVSNAIKLQQMAKELGADNIVKSAQQLESAASGLEKGWAKAASSAQNAAKQI